MKGFFGWFRNGAKMKRWIALILIGIISACYGMASILTAERLDFWPLAKIVACFVVGFVVPETVLIKASLNNPICLNVYPLKGLYSPIAPVPED